MKKLFVFFFKLFGWKVEGEMPEGSEKSLLVASPHTSNTDFTFGKAAFEILGLQGKFLIKKELFFWPLGTVLRGLGAIPVNRGESGIISAAVDLFSRNGKCSIIITPEGTRKYVKNWRKGFSRIARQANVPIVIIYVDYKRKVIGIYPELFWATENPSNDLKRLQDIFRTLNVTAKYPKKYSLSSMYNKWGYEKFIPSL